MNRSFAEEWLNNLKEYWFNKDIEKAVSLFANTSFYQETPFMKPYTTIEVIKQEYPNLISNEIKKVIYIKEKIINIICN